MNIMSCSCVQLFLCLTNGPIKIYYYNLAISQIPAKFANIKVFIGEWE